MLILKRTGQFNHVDLFVCMSDERAKISPFDKPPFPKRINRSVLRSSTFALANGSTKSSLVLP